MGCVLKVRGGYDDCIHVLARIQFVVVADAGDGAATLFLDEGSAFVTATVPDIRDGDELEVEVASVFLEGGDEGVFSAVAGADQRYAYAIVGAADGRIAACAGRNGRAGKCAAGEFNEILYGFGLP